MQAVWTLLSAELVRLRFVSVLEVRRPSILYNIISLKT